MDHPQPANFPSRSPLLPRLLLWLLVAALLATMFWQQPGPAYQWRLHVTGNATNLYAAMTGRPEEASEDAEAVLSYSQMDALGTWSPLGRGSGDVLHVVAWQEDLVALFADGGMFFFGPSGRGYAPSPKADDPQAWRWWLAAAAEDNRLLALGLSGDGTPVFSQRGEESWGDVEALTKLKADWSADTAAEMSAAIADGEFHVAWPARAVAETPTGQGPVRRWLMFAWRDARGTWKGPVEDKEIQLDGPPCVAPFGEKLAMVYREPAAAGDRLAASSARLAYAEFTKDHRWHRVRSVEVPPRTNGDAEVTGYGFTQFGKGHVLAVEYADGFVVMFRLEAESGRLESMASPPELAVKIRGGSRRSPGADWLLLSLMVLAGVVFVMSQVARRRLLRQRLADGTMSSEEVARIVAAQVERLMYLPVLVRRVGAVLIDIILLLPPAVLVIPHVVEIPPDLDGTQLPQEKAMIIAGVYLGMLVLYHIVMETIWQRTLGKMACGVRVVTVAGTRAAWWRVVIRNLLRPIDVFLVPMGLVGLFSIVWSRRNQTLGDMAAGTRVVPSATQISGGPQDSNTRTL